MSARNILVRDTKRSVMFVSKSGECIFEQIRKHFYKALSVYYYLRIEELKNLSIIQRIAKPSLNFIPQFNFKYVLFNLKV